MLCASPFGYPLRHPRGGRGRGPGARAGARRVSQVWWYGHQLLRLPPLHMCGRLLHEWLVNMCCRVEDERLSLARREQTARNHARARPCEMFANEPPPGDRTTKTYYLPSSVHGPPRHLRRLRIDALELGRRKGRPAWFITPNCDPRWPEIVELLLPGQTAADRPGAVVRVFHGRLTQMTTYLRTVFAGNCQYVIRVIEYQLRGVPRAHVVISAKRPPQTPEEVNMEVPRELPPEDSPFEHMAHKCARDCRPDGPDQEGAKGCPWPLAADAYFDARGYPHLRRRPRGGHCPNCRQGRAVCGRRNLCVNQLLVEYAP